MKKRIISLLLCLCILAACIPAVSAYSNLGTWAKESVEAMYDLGFLPDSLVKADMSKPITRGQMCQMAVLVYNQLMGTPGVGPDSTKNFDDTSDPDINYAFEQGIVGGYGDGNFGPNDPLTRQDFFKITYNMMATAYWDPNTITLASLNKFYDAGSISAYAVTPTKAMVAIGVVQGDGSYLKPKSNTSCQEAIVMFFRAYQYMAQWMNAQNEANKSVQIYAQGYSNISVWAIREVKEMDDNKLIPSVLDNCDMSKSITRSQMCSIAVLAYEKITGEKYTPTGTNHFSDCTDADVNAAHELGIVDGYGKGLFGPNNVLTREEFFKIMANFMKVVGYPREDTKAASLSAYRDGSKVADWAAPATRLMIYIGAVRGDGSNLNPKSDTSIEEAIAVFLRCYKYTVAWQEAHPDGEPEYDPDMALLDDMCAFAKSFVGYPYVYGGNGPNSFDCSGFVLYVYNHFGYSFSRGAQDQYRDGMDVSMDELIPGDLVFFHGGGSYITHVGFYLGDGYFVHAANPSRGVVIDNLYSGYYNSHFFSACRIITD